MNSHDEHQDVEFMLKRCLSLCLTDRKGAITNGQTIDFNLVAENEAYSATLYAPLALLSHAQRLVGSFSREVLPYVSSLVLRGTSISHSKKEQGVRSVVQDSKATLRSSLRSYERRTLSESDITACAVVGEEFIAHCESLIAFFDSKRTTIKNQSLIALLDWFHSKVLHIRIAWDSLAEKSQLPIARIRSAVSPERLQLTKNQNNTDTVGDSVPLNIVSTDEVEEICRKCRRGVRLAKRLLAWRERWKKTSSGFGPGSKLSFQQTRSAPALFEIWCFMELANAFNSTGKESLIQCSLLRGSTDTPSFCGSGAVDVYYDFHGTPQLLPVEQRVLNRIHVEWFLRNRNDYSKSVVIDTKYKSSESVNHLTTLGYMSAFQVNRGVAIFRQNLDSKALRSSEGDSHFALCRFGNEQIFAALLLVPRKEEIHQNAAAMQKLIDKVILA